MRLFQHHRIAIAEAMRGRLDALVERRVDRHAVHIAQLQRAAYVIGVVVGQQDRAQAQTVLLQRDLDRRGFARIHHDGLTGTIVQQPDVIIGQRRQRYDVQENLRIIAYRLTQATGMRESARL
jgi:hypothetical protein